MSKVYYKVTWDVNSLNLVIVETIEKPVTLQNEFGDTASKNNVYASRKVAERACLMGNAYLSIPPAISQ